MQVVARRDAAEEQAGDGPPVAVAAPPDGASLGVALPDAAAVSAEPLGAVTVSAVA